MREEYQKCAVCLERAIENFYPFNYFSPERQRDLTEDTTKILLVASISALKSLDSYMDYMGAETRQAPSLSRAFEQQARQHGALIDNFTNATRKNIDRQTITRDMLRQLRPVHNLLVSIGQFLFPERRPV